jgi:dihydroxyacetone kinase-like protein
MITKFINSTDQITRETLEGYTMAYADKVKLGGENIVVRVTPKSMDKVAIVTLGGSGHEPALSGFVGEGMLDCSVVGDIFAAPGAQRLFQALQLFKRDAGILLVVLNHSGDVMSANMATQLAERSGIRVVKLLTHEDISAGLDVRDEDRRGLAGCIPLYKIIGAAAEQGKSIEEIAEIGERFISQTATLAVAMRSCTHPQNGAVIAELPEGEIEIGMGQHGEGGGGRQMLTSADDVASQMISQLIRKIKPVKGDQVLLIINGVGATTHMEMSIIFRKAAMVLAESGVVVADGRIAELLTVQEQAGFQMILAKLDADHFDLLKNVPSNAPYWVNIGK